MKDFLIAWAPVVAPFFVLIGGFGWYRYKIENQGNRIDGLEGISKITVKRMECYRAMDKVHDGQKELVAHMMDIKDSNTRLETKMQIVEKMLWENSK